ncbi:hypothetical protein MLD38_019914 [Melastoma candidum]|nr:hypothetical protein MLD38_019914 [Melastoma candidum]
MLHEGLSIYNMMMEKYRIAPEIEHYACVVDLLGRSGDLIGAYEFVQKMPMRADENVFGSLLNACRVHKNLEFAKVVERQIMKGNSNQLGHHVLLHNAYASDQRWGDALMIRKAIKEKGLTKDPGSSWVQIGKSFHVFHAGGWTHPQSSDVYRALDDLFAEMTDKGLMSTSNEAARALITPV